MVPNDRYYMLSLKTIILRIQYRVTLQFVRNLKFLALATKGRSQITQKIIIQFCDS